MAIIQRGKIIRQASVREITSGNVFAVLRADGDADRLCRLAEEYSGAVSARTEGESVLLELADDDLAAVNRFMVERGVYLSHLAVRHRTLEDVFMELTGAGHTGMGDVP